MDIMEFLRGYREACKEEEENVISHYNHDYSNNYDYDEDEGDFYYGY